MNKPKESSIISPLSSQKKRLSSKGPNSLVKLTLSKSTNEEVALTNEIESKLTVESTSNLKKKKMRNSSSSTEELTSYIDTTKETNRLRDAIFVPLEDTTTTESPRPLGSPDVFQLSPLPMTPAQTTSTTIEKIEKIKRKGKIKQENETETFVIKDKDKNDKNIRSVKIMKEETPMKIKDPAPFHTPNPTISPNNIQSVEDRKGDNNHNNDNNDKDNDNDNDNDKDKDHSKTFVKSDPSCFSIPSSSTTNSTANTTTPTTTTSTTTTTTTTNITNAKSKSKSKAKVKTTSTPISADNFSFFDYVSREIYTGSFTAEEAALQSSRRERILNFMKVPWELEKLIFFSFFICLDSFLFTLTLLPLRVLVALGRWIYGLLFISDPKIASKYQFSPTQLCDTVRLLIGICSLLFLNSLNSSIFYHYIRGQAPIKLYVIFNLLEIFDKLCASFGQDILDSLFWTLTDKGSGWKHRAMSLFHFLVALFYVSLHSFVLFLHVVTLNVAINASSSALLTLLISNQFVELKGSVFKKFEQQNLFQISCSDIVERFQLFVYLTIITLSNLSDLGWNTSDPFLSVLLTQIIMVGASECVVDWVKHAFITKFNRIQADVYTKFYTILCRDLASARSKSNIMDPSHLVSRRIGFSSLPLFCILLRTILQYGDLSWVLVLIYSLSFACFITLKILLSIHLLAHSITKVLLRPTPESTDLNHGKPEPLPTSLELTERWTLYSKRII